ncbi:hypothetical protein [Rhizobium leguminosarum]|uniref:hypothetical protein n=1 Tax=Rhizobium leguminosarum TaxID=384 RepID=UPI003F9CD3F0
MEIISARIVASELRVILRFKDQEYTVASPPTDIHATGGTMKEKAFDVLNSISMRTIIIEQTGASFATTHHAIMTYMAAN